MAKFSKILFVSTGNTSRGIIAELVMKEELRQRGHSEIEVASRGLVVLFPEPVNPKVALIVKNHGLYLEDRQAVQLTKQDVKYYNLILTITEEQKHKLWEDYPCQVPVYTIKEFAGEGGQTLDPYGKDMIDYEYCFREFERLVEKVCYRILEE